MFSKIASFFGSIFKRKVVAIALASTVVVGAGVGAGVAVYANTPENLVARSVAQVFSSITERQEIQLLANVLTKGSIQFSVGNFSAESAYYEYHGENLVYSDEEAHGETILDVSGKLYFGEKAFYAEDIAVDVEGFKLNADAYISEELVYVNEADLLGGAYGFSTKNLAEQFKNSIFAYGSGSDYAIPDQETYDLILNACKSFENSKKMNKDAQKLGKYIGKEVWEIVCDNAGFEVEKTTDRIDGKKQNVRVISVVLNGENMAEIIEDVYEFLLEDEEIIEYLEKYADSFALYLNNAGVEGYTMDEYYVEVLEAYDEAIDEICREAQKSEDELKFEITTPRASVDPISLEMYFDGESLILLDFGAKGLQKTDEIKLTIMGETASYKITQNDKNKYTAVFSYINEIEAKKYSVYVNVDRANKTYSLKFEDVWGGELDSWMQISTIVNSYEISGDFIKDGKTLKLTAKKLEQKESYKQNNSLSERITTSNCNIALTLNPSDKMPSAPKDYKSLSNITEQDMEKWLPLFMDGSSSGFIPA